MCLILDSCTGTKVSTTGDLEHFIFMDTINETHRVFQCYKNFHQVSGDMVHTCSDNHTWLGERPICEVDYMMEKYRLSASIGAVVVLFYLCLMLPDFLLFFKKKREIKDRLATLLAIRDERGMFSRTQSSYVRSSLLSMARARKSYFYTSYEEDFLGSSAGHLSRVRMLEARSPRSGSPRLSTPAKKRKAATFLTIMTNAFRAQQPDQDFV